jgi:hypothetical protein
MLSTLKAALIGVPLFFLLMLSFLGTVLAAAPFIGALLLALLAVFARAAFRASRDPARPRFIRRLALAAGAGCALLGLLAIPFGIVGSAYERFVDWHSSGAGLKPGMTVEEARGILARRSTVTDFAVDHPKDFRGTRFQVEPTGLASYKFEFPLGELYYLDVAVSTEGRVVEIKPWHD